MSEFPSHFESHHASSLRAGVPVFTTAGVVGASGLVMTGEEKKKKAEERKRKRREEGEQK